MAPLVTAAGAGLWPRLVDRAQSAKAGARLLRQSGLGSALAPASLARALPRLVQLGVAPQALIAAHAASVPDKTAVQDETRSSSYRELDREMAVMAAGLASLGVGPGRRVALLLGNCIEHLALQLVIPSLGAAVVEMGTRLTAREVDLILRHSRAEVLIHQPSAADVVGAADAARSVRCIELDSPAWHDFERASPRTGRRDRGDDGGVIVYTSGTTGTPKGAMRSLGGLSVRAALELMIEVGFRHDDRQLVSCPLYHSAAPVFAGMGLGLAGTCVLRDGLDDEALLRVLAEERITGAFMVPTMLSRLVAIPARQRTRFDVSRLRWVCSGAAPLTTATAMSFQEAFGRVLWNFYGATETGLVSLAGPEDHEQRPGTVGRPLPGNEIRILDDDDRELPRGEIGAIAVRNGMLIRGYDRDEGATAAAFHDGFFAAGDLGRIDEDGYLYLEGRKHDLIISGGVNVYPVEIENYLALHPKVLDVAVIGVPDPEWGERVKAVVVPRPGCTLSADELDHFCRKGLAPQKTPRLFELRDELPRNPTGKVLKRELSA